MKRTIACLLTAALLAAPLAGCGQTSTPSSAAEATATPAATAAPTPTPEPTATPAPTATPEPVTYTPGVRTEDGYTNTSLGFLFSPSENMVLATEEEMQALMQSGADFVYGDAPNSDQLMEQVQQTAAYELVAVDVATGSSVIIGTETLAMEGIDETQYIAAIQQQLSQVDAMQVTFDDPGTVTLGETTFTGVTYTAAANGMQSSQTMLLKKIDNTMCMIVLAYSDPTQYPALLNCFTTISAV